MTDLYPPEALAGIQQAVNEFGGGWQLPFPGIEALAADASLSGLSDEQLLLMEAKAEPQPWATYTQPLRLTSAGEPPYRRVVIACDDVRSMVAAGYPEIVQLTSAPWHYVELQTGHWPMLSAPVALADTLDALASAR